MANDNQMESLFGIHRDSKVSLVTYINKTNNANLDHEMVFFSPPFPVSETYRAGTTDRNTIVRITAREEYRDYRGSTILVYNRIEMGKLNSLLSFTLETHEPQTTHDLINPIWRRYGIIFEPEDIVDEPIINVNTDPEGDFIVKVKAHHHSLKWLGDCDIILKEGRVEFRDFLTETVLPGMNYPVEGDGSTGSAIVYMYSLDFTDEKSVIETYPVDYVIDEFDEDLVNAFKNIDINEGKDLWNLDPANPEWSLHGAEVIYNGVNDESLPTNKSFKYVMGLRLRDTVTTPPGVMYVHYNDTFDPMELKQFGY